MNPELWNAPKAVAQILTLTGFLKWCEGKPLIASDFKTEKGLT